MRMRYWALQRETGNRQSEIQRENERERGVEGKMEVKQGDDSG